MNINIGYICDNTILLSIIISVICTLLIFIDNKIYKVNKPYISYIRIFIVIMIGVNAMIYLKKMDVKNIDSKYTNVKIGEPDF
jgi:hypothetical protein